MSERDITDTPALAAVAARAALHDGDPDATGHWLLLARAHHTTHPDDSPRARDIRGSVDFLGALRGDTHPAAITDLTAAAHRQLSPLNPFRPYTCALTAVGYLLTGYPDQADAWARRGEALAAALGSHHARAHCLATLALLADHADHTPAAAALADRARTILADHRLQELPTSGYPLSVTAFIQAHRGDRSTARETLLQARRLTGRADGLVPWLQALNLTLQATSSLHLQHRPPPPGSSPHRPGSCSTDTLPRATCTPPSPTPNTPSRPSPPIPPPHR